MTAIIKAERIADPLQAALRTCRTHLIEAGVFSAFLNILYLAPTLYMLQVYDRVVPSQGFVTLGMLTLIFVFAVFTICGLDLIRSRLLVRASIRLDRRLSVDILSALLRSSNAADPKSSSLLREFDVLKSTLTGAGAMALFDAPWSLIYIGVCFLIHWSLGCMAMFGAGLLLMVTWLNERATGTVLKEALTQSNLSYIGVDSSLYGAGTVRALGMRRAVATRHLREREQVLELQSSSSFTGGNYTSIVKASRLLLQSLALGLGALLAISQLISPGAIFAASLLVSRALAPIELIIGGWKSMIQARSAYQSIGDLLATAGPDTTPMTLPTPTGHVEVENLVVASPDGSRALLNNVSFLVEPGEMLGIVGPSGAGKSTLVKALVGSLPAYGGAVRIDGARLIDWPEEQLGRATGYVPQDATLFRGSIRENIARFDTENDDIAVDTVDADVVVAAQLCGAHDLILRLPQGYETQLGFGGAGLSVGQAQRVALARALYGNPAIVIMDEPNASLDAEGEVRLIDAIEELRRRKVTVIVVAHRTGILATADKLLVLRDGRIERFGPRAVVLAGMSGQPVAATPVMTAATGE